MDVTNFGTQYAKENYTTKVYHDNGDLSLDASAGKINITSMSGIDVGGVGILTTVKGDLTVDGAFSFGSFGNLVCESVESSSALITGTSIMQGDVDINGSLDVNNETLLGGLGQNTTVRGELNLNAGNVNVASETSLNGVASAQYFVLGDGTEGSWRIGVSSDNKLQFQRHNGTGWTTVNQMGN